MAELLPIEDLPPEFSYPPAFVRVVELGLTELEPWQILTGDPLRDRYLGLSERYPSRRLVPLARRLDRDDVACWEGASREVIVIHDFASPGWEQVKELSDFNDWLRRAIEDLISFHNAD